VQWRIEFEVKVEVKVEAEGEEEAEVAAQTSVSICVHPWFTSAIRVICVICGWHGCVAPGGRWPG
jgi:hypothetical protein